MNYYKSSIFNDIKTYAAQALISKKNNNRKYQAILLLLLLLIVIMLFLRLMSKSNQIKEKLKKVENCKSTISIGKIRLVEDIELVPGEKKMKHELIKEYKNIENNVRNIKAQIEREKFQKEYNNKIKNNYELLLNQNNNKIDIEKQNNVDLKRRVNYVREENRSLGNQFGDLLS